MKKTQYVTLLLIVILLALVACSPSTVSPPSKLTPTTPVPIPLGEAPPKEVVYIDVPYTVMVDYEEIETYYVDEPYQEIRDVNETLKYRIILASPDRPQLDFVNMSKYSGNFTVRFNFYTMDKGKYHELQKKYPQGFQVIEEIGIFYVKDITSRDVLMELGFKEFILEKSLYLEPDERVLVWWSVEELTGREEREMFSICQWEILPGEVEIKEIVTKYRQVSKQRVVIKQREETRYNKVPLP